jgi:hypothetical protein
MLPPTSLRPSFTYIRTYERTKNFDTYGYGYVRSVIPRKYYAEFHRVEITLSLMKTSKSLENVEVRENLGRESTYNYRRQSNI